MVPIMLSPAVPGQLPTPLSLGVKRRRVDDDYSTPDNAPPSSSLPTSSPTKKQKVRFEENTDIVEFNDDKPFDLVREEVRRGLHNHTLGDDKGYSALCTWFDETASAGDLPSSRLLRKYVVALTGHIRLLDKRCNELVQLILESNWIGRSDDYVAAYVRFLAVLVSAHGSQLSRVLYMLVGKFSNRMPHE
jgi:RNA polymerase I-specific transcription initiation factor RRN3